MTLLINEIHVNSSLDRGHILLAADRRITLSGRFLGNRKKLFRIPYLNAGVGYFGLGVTRPGHFFSSWLPNFIRRANDVPSMEQFAARLRETLNRDVQRALLRQNGSGFHVCGYNSVNIPELHFISNIGGMDGPFYRDFRGTYSSTEDFLRRDALGAGWSGQGAAVPRPFIQYYVNGDVRPFHAVWRQLDPFIETMVQQDGFSEPAFPESEMKRADWKMRTIGRFYSEYATEVIIGPPIDTFVLVPESVA